MSEPRVTANSIAWLITCAVLLAAGLPVAAAEDSADDKWTFRGEAYLWAPAIKGHTSAADPIDIQFSDIFQNLGIAAMGTLAARKDKLTLFTDLIYYGDVGTGQSDLTWQALGAFSYKFEKFEGVLGYRYLRWNFDEGKALGEDYDNLYVTGPYAGVKFDF